MDDDAAWQELYDASWQELMDSTVVVDGVQKRFGDCNRDDLNKLIFDGERAKHTN
jgi:hypothetical protein